MIGVAIGKWGLKDSANSSYLTRRSLFFGVFLRGRLWVRGRTILEEGIKCLMIGKCL